MHYGRWESVSMPRKSSQLSLSGAARPNLNAGGVLSDVPGFHEPPKKAIIGIKPMASGKSQIRQRRGR
jgi:hypothetical protein